MYKQRIGLFLGRFQPFHNAHLEIVRRSFDFVKFLTIGVGSSQYSRTRINPFSYDERRGMIEDALVDTRDVDIMSIPDINDPPNYVKYVMKSTAYGPFDVVFTDNPYTIELFRGKFPIIIITPEGDIPRGTQIRDWYYNGDEYWRKYVPKSTEVIMDREYPILKRLVSEEGINLKRIKTKEEKYGR
jgi:nicotinamide-nucleotide adenylyltransferase